MQIDLPVGTSAEVLTETTSTMDAARSYQGPAPHWILAKRQTQARGRRGRSWLSADGAFAATLILPVACTPQDAACRSFVAACALLDALAHFVPRTKLSHKWPNDVLLQGGKVAGILLEAIGNGTMVDRLNIGIGVNLADAPADVPDAAFAPIGVANVRDTPVVPTDFLPVLAGAFDRYERLFKAKGFRAIQTIWTDDAARLGQVITADTGRDRTTGTFEGIDDTGNLILNTGDGRRAIPAADIFF